MKLLTFDIEEYYLEAVKSGGTIKKRKEYDRLLFETLDLLDENNIKGTFFCLGKIGSDFPEVIKAIDHRGHEIGCHSNKHNWITHLSEKEFYNDTREAIDALEQVTGKKVLSYRAPAFSIGENNRWAFEILADCGIENDSSVFPDHRDFGGFPSFPSENPCVIELNGKRINEFPIPLYHILNQKVAFSGGGYFRLFPYWFIKRALNKNKYSMCYFHLADLIPESSGIMTRAEYEEYFQENGSLPNRLKRYIKSNIGKSGAYQKMATLINSHQFINIQQAIKENKITNCLHL